MGPNIGAKIQELREPNEIDLLNPYLLVVDDNAIVRQQLKHLYVQNGYSVVTVGSAEAAIRRLQGGDIDFTIADINLPQIDGVQLIQYIYQNHPDVPVVAITDHADISAAVKVLKLGASDFIVKPFDLNAVQESTRLALQKSRVYMEIRHLRRWLRNRSIFSGILSKTPEMHRVFEIIRMLANTDTTVLVEGETGTGKELVATAIHYQSGRRRGPFVTINCAGFPESLLESELFGYEKGAFTGAEHSRAGKIELANGGTLFLDEIESISVVMQGKLLRVLQDQKVQRLGATSSSRVDMRIIAASNVPLKQMVAEGRMRADFYYRINIVPIHLIPLRRRKVDIPLLVHDFLKHHAVAVSKGIDTISKHVMDALLDYSWPGNVRELQNVLERAIVLTTGRTIVAVDLPSFTEREPGNESRFVYPGSLDEWLKEHEKKYLVQKLNALGGNVALTAKSSGIGLRTLSRKIRLYDLDPKAFKRTNGKI